MIFERKGQNQNNLKKIQTIKSILVVKLTKSYSYTYGQCSALSLIERVSAKQIKSAFLQKIGIKLINFRVELQNHEMAKIQAAISGQLEEVTSRQQHLEQVNQVLNQQ